MRTCPAVGGTLRRSSRSLAGVRCFTTVENVSPGARYAYPTASAPRSAMPQPLPEPVEDVAREQNDAAAPRSTSDPLRLYVRQIGGGPLLTRQEERELARRKDAGDEEAKRKLIESNLRLVMSITRHYT